MPVAPLPKAKEGRRYSWVRQDQVAQRVQSRHWKVVRQVGKMVLLEERSSSSRWWEFWKRD